MQFKAAARIPAFRICYRKNKNEAPRRRSSHVNSNKEIFFFFCWAVNVKRERKKKRKNHAEKKKTCRENIHGRHAQLLPVKMDGYTLHCFVKCRIKPNKGTVVWTNTTRTADNDNHWRDQRVPPILTSRARLWFSLVFFKCFEQISDISFSKKIEFQFKIEGTNEK